MTLYREFVKQSSLDDMQFLCIEASSKNDASGNRSVKILPEDCYYESNEWYALSKSDKDKVLKARSGINGWKKSYKSGGNSKSGGVINNGQRKWKYKIAMIEKKVRNPKRQL